MTEILSSSGFGYAIIVALVAADAVFPAVPGETALIGGALLAADNELSLPAVIAAGVVGGIAGDNLSYLLGTRLGRPATRTLFRSERAQSRLAWAHRQIQERGPVIILSGRFIPVGRTATTFASGALGMPWRRFFPVDALAVLVWSLYASLVGYYAGRAFGISGPAVLLSTIVLATVIGLGGEGVRRLLARRRDGT